ncbi:MAG TPA: helix-turn-helix transcriptional regulator [Nocardioides sp.]
MDWTPEEIRRRRLAKGYRSQRALATELGVSLKAVTNWETGVGEPSAANIRRLDEVLGTTVTSAVPLSEATDSQLLAEIANRLSRSATPHGDLPEPLKHDGRWPAEGYSAGGEADKQNERRTTQGNRANDHVVESG